MSKGVTGNGEVVSVRSTVEDRAKQMQMQSKRINRTQRRAKRRFFALAIAATVFAGYSAISLFAEDAGPIQVPLTNLSTVPGVRAIGIRMINPSGNSQAARTDSLPMPKASSVLSDSLSLLPSCPTSLSEGLAQLPLPTATSIPSQLDSSLPPAYPSQTGSDSPSSQSQETTVFSNLPAPPRMSDILVKNPNGKVVMKLSGSEKDTGSLPIPINHNVVVPQSAISQSQTAVRISIGDNVEGQSGSQAKNRTPQLVKSKPTQIEHTVVLAQSTELESPSSISQPDAIVPTLDVEISPVPHSISTGILPSSKKSDTSSQATVTDSVPDAFASLTTVKESNFEPKNFGEHAHSTGSERRKFDTRVKSQTPIATLELECLTATNMDLTSKLNAIAVQNENICKVVQNERTLSLVGNQVGTTLVQIWTADLGDKPQVVRVNVHQPWGKVQATKSEVKDIKQVIAQGFPRADVDIVSKGDGMIEVRGTTDSEESARRILELVRKLYLVPVQDRLTVKK